MESEKQGRRENVTITDFGLRRSAEGLYISLTIARENESDRWTIGRMAWRVNGYDSGGEFIHSILEVAGVYDAQDVIGKKAVAEFTAGGGFIRLTSENGVVSLKI